MEYNFILGIFGEGRVGKTCIVKRLLDQGFDEHEETSSDADKVDTSINIGKDIVNLDIYDLPGQESFHSFASNYIKGLNGVILVYDIVTKYSFEKIDFWFKQMQENLDKNIPILLLANKCDLNEQRVVTKEDGEKLAKEKNMLFFECSAKNNDNIKNAIEELAKKLIKAKQQQTKNDNNKKPKEGNNNKEQKKKKKCYLF